MTGLVVALALVAAPRVLVLNLEPLGVEPEVARAIDPLVLHAVGEVGVDVIAENEIQKIADVEASKAELGCDTSSCLAELAGAMGAELVLFGSVSRLGSTTTVNLSLFDNRSTRIERDALSVQDVGALPKELPARVKDLVARVTQPSRGTQAPKPEPALSPLFFVGAGGIGVGALAAVGGGVWLGINEAIIQDPAVAGASKQDAQTAGRIGLGVAVAGLAVAAAGAVLLALSGGES
jgi:hypothetical protein